MASDTADPRKRLQLVDGQVAMLTEKDRNFQLNPAKLYMIENTIHCVSCLPTEPAYIRRYGVVGYARRLFVVLEEWRAEDPELWSCDVCRTTKP